MKKIVSPSIRFPKEWWIWVVAGLLFALNFPLLLDHRLDEMIFLPGPFLEGEWWRLITFPFIHVSIYHFALDASAALILLHCLREALGQRLGGALIMTILGSALIPWSMDARVGEIGLCGFSGPAHGLMLVYAWHLARASTRLERASGLGLLLLLFGKVFWEIQSSTLQLLALHWGDVGTPIPSSHVGGMLGSVIWLRRNYSVESDVLA